MLRSDREIMLKLEKDLARSRFMQVSTKLAVMESTDVDVQRQYDRSVDIRLEYVRVLWQFDVWLINENSDEFDHMHYANCRLDHFFQQNDIFNGLKGECFLG